MPRGSKPGERRGGRKKGVPNKSTARVKEMLDNLGCDPIKELAEIGMQAKKVGDMQMATTCFRELAQYVESKKKAVEVDAKVEASVDLEVTEIALTGPSLCEKK